LVKVTLEKPPTTLGENQFESSFLFLENAFYSERNIQQKKISKQTFTTYLIFRASQPTGKNLQTAKLNNNKCCTASSIFVPKFQL